MSQAHPLLALMLAAAEGVFPPVDGRAEFLPGLARGQRAVVAFTGHAVLATEQAPSEFAGLELDGYGGAMHPQALLRLAGPGGHLDHHDLILVARGTGGERLPESPELAEHPRARYARRLRDRVRVFGDERGVVTLAEGLAGRLELSIETTPDAAGRSHGRGLLLDALSNVPESAPVFAAVAPGNARSLRRLLSVGFTPIASQVIAIPASPATP